MSVKTRILKNNKTTGVALLSAIFSLSFNVNASSPIAQPLSAQKITAENAAGLVQGGPDATGGIGDWSLSNGTLCAIISGVDHESEFSTKGGALIDLGFCNRDDDHYTFGQDLLNGERTRPLDTYSINGTQSDSSASIIVRLKNNGIEQTTVYHLDKYTPQQLHISKTLTRITDDDNEFNVYSSIHFNHHSLEPFVFSSKDTRNNNGFKHQDFVNRGTSALTSATRNADTIITISPPDAETPIAYGWQVKSAQRLEGDESFDIPVFALADDQSNAFLYIPDTFYIGDNSDISWMQLGQIPLLSLDTDTSLIINEVIYIGLRGDVASITDQLFTGSASLSGKVDEVNSAIHIDKTDGTPISHIRPNPDGSFQLNLPKGDYVLRHVGSANRVSKTNIKLDQESLNVGILNLPKVAKLALPRDHAMRLIIKGVNGTPNPNVIDTFTQMSIIDDDGLRYLESNNQIFLAGLDSDLNEIALANGDYIVYATRGPEYSLEKTNISITNNESQTLNIAIPKHLIATPKYISSDLHVHSGISYDNSFAEKERVRTFVAEHGEVMVSSEHDTPVDFTPLITEMGLNHEITAIAAVEVTSLLPSKNLPFTGGHANVFPFKPKPYGFRRGAIDNENRRLRDIIHDVKHSHAGSLVQLNHPRTNLDLSSDLPHDHEDLIDYAHYLDHLGVAAHPYNPEKPLDSSPNNTLINKDPKTGLRDIDFDLLEMINPGGPDHDERIKAVRKDWLSFLKQGEKIVATANSDSHSSNNQVAVPRTMVAMTDDSVSTFNESEFISSLKKGNAYGTTGPMIKVSLSGTPMGGTFKGAQAELNINILSTDWINVHTLKVQVNGETVSKHSLEEAAQDNITSHTFNLPMNFDKDSFVTIEVTGNADEDYSIVYPEITPYAFSNPIYVDFDTDDTWQAPGL